MIAGEKTVVRYCSVLRTMGLLWLTGRSVLEVACSIRIPHCVCVTQLLVLVKAAKIRRLSLLLVRLPLVNLR